MKQNPSVNLLVRLQELDFTLDEVIIEFEQVIAWSVFVVEISILI